MLLPPNAKIPGSLGNAKAFRVREGFIWFSSWKSTHVPNISLLLIQQPFTFVLVTYQEWCILCYSWVLPRRPVFRQVKAQETLGGCLCLQLLRNTTESFLLWALQWRAELKSLWVSSPPKTSLGNFPGYFLLKNKHRNPLLCYGCWTVSPSKFTCWSPSASNVTVFGNRALNKVIKVKWLM